MASDHDTPQPQLRPRSETSVEPRPISLAWWSYARLLGTPLNESSRCSGSSLHPASLNWEIFVGENHPCEDTAFDCSDS